MEKLKVSALRRLLPRLPEPLARYAISSPSAKFEIYRAKDLFNPHWKDPILKQLVLDARCSYSEYGVRPLLDQYDKKAAIYLVRVIYPTVSQSERFIEEWLSIRMVPGHGEPIGGGELEIYTYRGKTIDYWLRRIRFPDQGEKFWNYVASSSRMCGIHPYTQEPQQRNAERIRPTRKHKHTALCFALIHVQFLVDYPPPIFPYRCITAIIRSELAMKGLCFARNGENLGPTFTPAWQMLGIKDKSQIKLNRDVYAYEFPLYWFNVQELKKLLRDLVEQGKLLTRDHVTLRNLGSLLTTDGKIANSRMTGKELRKLVDENVSDVPELKITEGYVWYTKLNDTLRAMGIDVAGAASIIDSYYTPHVAP